MSTGSGVWRQTIARAANLRAQPLGAAERDLEPATTETNTALETFVRQIFFASARRAHVFFASCDSETDISDFCRRIGRSLAHTSRASVGIVARNHGPASVAVGANESLTAVDLGGNLWSFPLNLYETHFADGNLPEEIQRLDRVIFGASIRDGAAPLFCRASDGAVLVITASQTRREAALRAKEILLSWNAQLLGAVLDNRLFPVPESIYRRL